MAMARAYMNAYIDGLAIFFGDIVDIVSFYWLALPGC
jgi:hypothetical protein